MMKPEEISEKLKEELDDRLQSVVLYGSAAAGDFIEKKSDYNLLIVADTWDPPALDAIRPVVKSWIKAGNPAPLCFTPERLRNAADVFPMEMLDILDAHQVLLGEDPLEELKVKPAHLRHQVEFELRSKLLQLRQAYFQLDRPKKELAGLLVQSLSSFLVVFRGALRLFEPGDVPRDKMDALRALAKTLDFPSAVFEEIYRVKTGEVKASNVDAQDLFGRYLMKIELVLDRVDSKLKES